MNYIEIDFNKVKGFNKLTQEQQELFKSVYKLHNSCQGNDYKEKWIPILVIWVKENSAKYSYLKVVFKNGEWLHYTQRKDWH